MMELVSFPPLSIYTLHLFAHFLCEYMSRLFCLLLCCISENREKYLSLKSWPLRLQMIACACLHA
jgi:hypothetical protein